MLKSKFSCGFKMLPVQRLILCPGPGCLRRPMAGTSHTAAFNNRVVSQSKQPESLLYFCTATKEI